jgi:RNA polymerase sigma factor (TIGR02999 family)
VGTPTEKDVTTLLLEWSNGDASALNQLAPLVYKELHRLAAGQLRRERPDHTLQSTALVHEAYLKLIDQRRVHLNDRNQFFAFASQTIRRILVNHARAHNAVKRGGGKTLLELDESIALGGRRDVDLVALDEALEDLAKLDPRQSRIVELRFFGGLSIEDTAKILSVSPATVKRDWDLSRAWLYRWFDRSSHAGT